MNPRASVFIPSNMARKSCKSEVPIYHGVYMAPEPVRSMSPASIEKSLMWQEASLEIMEIPNIQSLGGDRIYPQKVHFSKPIGWEMKLIRDLMTVVPSYSRV